MAAGEGSRNRWRRYVIGKPARWQGIVWLGLGLCWFGVTASDPDGAVWRWVLGSVYVAFGALTLVVGQSDYRHGRGRYAPQRPDEHDDLDRLQAAFEPDQDLPSQKPPSRTPPV